MRVILKNLCAFKSALTRFCQDFEKSSLAGRLFNILAHPGSVEAVQRLLKQIKQWIVKSKNSRVKSKLVNIQGASATESKYSDNDDPVAVEVEPTFPVLKKNF